MVAAWASRWRAEVLVAFSRLGGADRLRQARKFALLLLVLIPAIMIGLQQPPPLARGMRCGVVAAAPEAGGFQPDSITVYSGQRLRLRFHSADTTHGVAIGPGLGIDLGDLRPVRSR